MSIKAKLPTDVIRLLLSYLPADITLAIDVKQLISTKSKDLWLQLLIRDYNMDVNNLHNNLRFQYLICNNDLKAINYAMLWLSKVDSLRFYGKNLPHILPGRNWQLLLPTYGKINSFNLTEQDAHIPCLLYIIYYYYNTNTFVNILNKSINNLKYNPNNWVKPRRPVGLKLLNNNRYLVILK